MNDATDKIKTAKSKRFLFTMQVIKGSPDPSLFNSEINVGKSRIRYS